MLIKVSPTDAHEHGVNNPAITRQVSVSNLQISVDASEGETWMLLGHPGTVSLK